MASFPQKSKKSPTSIRVVALAATTLALVLAACSNDEADDKSPSTDPSTAPSTAPGETVAGDFLDSACTDITGTLTLYSGRSESLVAGLYEQFTLATGIKIEARYGDSGELAGQILTEGSASPADVFFSQDAGALGAVDEAELFAPINPATLARVPSEYQSETGSWIGASGRVRVILYNPDLAPAPPKSIDELLDPQWKGRIGFAPTNASWQSFVTGLRVLRGEDGAREWLEGFSANSPVAYEKNGAVRDAVNAGEVALGLVNHYYLFEKIAADGVENVVAKNQFLSSQDPGGLVNVAGVGILEKSDDAQAGQCFAAYLVSDPAQQYFVEESYEYPLVAGIDPYEGLPSLAELDPPKINLADLSSIAQTQDLLNQVGLLTL